MNLDELKQRIGKTDTLADQVTATATTGRRGLP
jgi:hypothetical protein